MSETDIYDLISEAEDLGYGPTRVALLDEAVRSADALNDLELSYYARKKLIDATTALGDYRKALVAFSWCLAQTDDDSERFPEEDILWEFKWILGAIVDFPAISLQQIDSLQNDYEGRIKRLGYGMRSALKLRWRNLVDTGRLEEAKPFVDQWKKSKTGWPSDCPACERDSYVDWLIYTKRYAAALKSAQPILDGELSCRHIPHTTLPSLLHPLVMLGRMDEAADIHKKGYRLNYRSQKYTHSIGSHVLYLTRIGNLTRGLKLFEKHLTWATESILDTARWHYFVAGEFLFETLASTSNRSRKLKLPRALAIYREDHTYAPAELADWFGNEASQIARKFDDRNQNNWFQQKWAANREFAGLEAVS